MKVLSRLVFLFLVTAWVSSASGQAVFFPGTGNYYDFVTTNVTWAEAQDLATSQVLFGVQGHLATLTTQEENDFLLDSFGGDSGWIGLSQAPGSIEPDQGFEWVTGEEFAFTSWNGIEPNNAFGNENFVEFFNGNWNDLGPTSNRRYYVEFETSAIPEPSAVSIVIAGISVLLGRRRKTSTLMK